MSDSEVTGIQQRLDGANVWRRVAEGTAGETGARFFFQLVESLSTALGAHGAWVTRWRKKQRRLHSYALFLDGEFVPDFNYDIDGTPCELVVEQKTLIHIPEDILRLYPDNAVLQKACAMSFMGMALLDVDGSVLGHLALLDNRPMPMDARLEAVFRVFSARAAAELRRLRSEHDLQQREATLARVMDGAMDAIVDMNRELEVTHANAAAESVFGLRDAALRGARFEGFLARESLDKLKGLMRILDARPEGQRASWIAGGLSARTSDGRAFPAEASLSRSEDSRGEPFYTLILRNSNERLEAERTIELLSSEADYLREALSSTRVSIGMVGKSPAFRELQAQIQEVAASDATVLVTGETGTGKELVCDALHELSQRKERRLVKVNCGAIPENLIESEFFGHEAGAFTGATRAREGRFTLADRGTLFLDEVGELPLSLQPKLLRVIQEGEFEAVGSTRLRRVDVRLVAATNRDLAREVEAGRFREDLYYRLAVFPLRVPPLRERRPDIPLLAQAFAERIAKRMGKRLEPLSDHSCALLRAYDWPGNVRELINVIERAVITARGSVLDLSRALPETSPPSASRIVAAEAEPDSNETILTEDQLRKLERENLERALKATQGRIAGPGGAAGLLGMKPSTLRSRLQALGIKTAR